MEQIQLKASLREETGKQAVKKLRNLGRIPATVYHRGEKPLSVVLAEKEISKIIRSAGGENVLINLSVEKEKKKNRAVIIKEVQHDPVKRNILHVDFNEISLTEQITVEVEVVAVGESIGVKQEKGMLDHPLRMLKIQCLPTDIPKHIDVDVSNLKLNDSIHVKDLKVSDKIKILNDPETLLFQVKLHEEKVEEAVPGEVQEVEVIREKKAEEEPKAGAGEKAKEEAKPKEPAKK
jgi:large subunit ribosomal protein L25